MDEEEFKRLSKEHDFQWIRDLSKEDYEFLSECSDMRWLNLINKIAIIQINKAKEQEK